MTSSDAETLRTIVWGIVALFAIQGVTVYTVVRVLVTGKAIFERQALPGEPRRVVGLGER